MHVEGIKKEWVGREFDVAEFEVTADDIVGFARAVGETEPRFTDPAHQDFQAPPTFTSRFVSRRVMPEAFPRISSRGFDAGKRVMCHGPVRPGKVTAKSRIADVYEKTGRSGPMVFIVHRMEFTNAEGQLVSTVDWRMVRQPDPKEEGA